MIIMKTIIVEKEDQIIPKEILAKMKIKKGDSITFFFDNDKLLIEKGKKSRKQLADDFSDLVKASESTLSFWDNETDKVWNNV